MTETPKPSKEKQLQIITMAIWFGMIGIILMGFVLFPVLKILPPKELHLVQIVIVFIVIANFCLLPFVKKRVLKK